MQYAILWSASAQKLHMELLSKTLEMGRLSYFEDRPSDYILVALAKTESEAIELHVQLIEKKDLAVCEGVS